MRILQVVHQFPPTKIGGTEIYTQNLASSLATQGHEVTVFHREALVTDQPCSEERVFDGVRIHRVCYNVSTASPLRSFLRSFSNGFIEKDFARLLNEARPDVVHFQHLKDLSLALIDVTARHGIPLLMTLHDYWLLCGNAQLVRPNGSVCPGPLLWLNCAHCAAARVERPHLLFGAPLIASLFAYRSLMVRRAMSRVPLFITPTLFTKRVFERHGLPQAKIRHLAPGIDIEVPRTKRVDERDRVVQFVYVGGLSWQKGVHVLVEAFNGIDRAEARLCVYGDESSFPEYSASLHEQATNPAIQFMGRVPHQELGQVLADADVVVVPSVWYETYCLIIQEAFAAKVPVIASNLGALAERVTDGVDGLLVPPHDAGALRGAMQKVIDDRSLLAGLRESVPRMKRLREHTEEILTLYEGLLAPGRQYGSKS
jgi:glycosyltransferase involved in cell wall biosynthesis